jgi:hypothetical protein
MLRSADRRVSKHAEFFNGLLKIAGMTGLERSVDGQPVEGCPNVVSRLLGGSARAIEYARARSEFGVVRTFYRSCAGETLLGSTSRSIVVPKGKRTRT